MKLFKITSLLCLALACAPLLAEININTASEQEIAEELQNIGLSKASAIIRYREDNGPFKTVDEIAKVRGIGMSTVEKNRHLMTVGPVSKDAMSARKKKTR